MYTTSNNRQIDRQLDIVEEEVGTGRCIQHRTRDRLNDSYIERRKRRQAQIDAYKIEQQREREIVTQRGGEGGRHRQMYTTSNNRQIERQLDREEGEVGTDRCILHRTIDRQRDSLQHRPIARQVDSLERRGRKLQIDVHNIKQQIDREIVRQR